MKARIILAMLAGAMLALRLPAQTLVPAGEQNPQAHAFPVPKAPATVRADDPIVTFGDATLENCVRETLQISRPIPIRASDMERLTTLQCVSKEIKSLRGLEYAVNLESLNLNANRVASVGPLWYLTNLRTLWLADNGMNSIDSLASLTNLTKLELYGNEIEEINALSGMKQLNNLVLSKNKIQHLDALRGITGLTLLKLDDNEIADISPLNNLTSLRTLWLHTNKIQNLGQNGGLRNLTNLDDLQLHSNPLLEILEPISGLTKLTGLTLHACRISSVAPLSGLTNLTSLTLSYNRLDNADLRDLYTLDRLTTLDLRSNAGITSGKALQTLADSLASLECDQIKADICCGINDCFDDDLLRVVRQALEQTKPDCTFGCINRNDILLLKRLRAWRLDRDTTEDKLDGLEFGVNLTHLELPNNEIADLAPLDSLYNLKVLILDNNRIQRLEALQQIENLDSLSLAENDLRNVNALGSLEDLEYLQLSQNNIDSARALAKLEKLRTLDLSHNQLRSSTGLGNKPQLDTLRLGNNQLFELNGLGNLPVLRQLALNDNLLDHDDLPSLYHLDKLETLALRGNSGISDGKAVLWLAENLDSLECEGIDWEGCCGVDSFFVNTALLGAVRDALSRIDPGGSLDCISKKEIEMLTGLRAPYFDPDTVEDSLEGIGFAKNLNRLELPDNEIADLSPLESLSKLQVLILDKNRIRRLEALQRLASLKTLSLTENDISDVKALGLLDSLEFLQLRQNEIGSADALASLRQLRALDLSSNQLKASAGLGNKAKLDSLLLGDNDLSELDSLAGRNNLPALRYLTLNDNSLGHEDLPALYDLKELRYLNLSGNQRLTSGMKMQELADELPHLNCDTIIWDHCCGIEEYFVSFPLLEAVRATLSRAGDSTENCINADDILRLDSLDASGLEITSLGGLDSAKNLVQLNLRQNRLRDSALTTLSKLPGLQTLDLGYNQLQRPEALRTMKQLVSLKLDNNQIDTLAALAGLTGLTRLDLRANRLDTLDISDLHGLINLRWLDLRGNAGIDSCAGRRAVDALIEQVPNLSLDSVWWDGKETRCHFRPPSIDSERVGAIRANLCETISLEVRVDDADGDPVNLTIAWGDSQESILGPKAAGSTFLTAHAYSYPDTFEVLLSAEDSTKMRSKTDSITVIMSARPVDAPGYNEKTGLHFSDALTISLKSETPGAVIYFKLDGSDPSRRDSLYSGPLRFTPPANVLIKARAYLLPCDSSAVTAASYELYPLPKISPPADTIAGAGVPMTVVTTIQNDHDSLQHTLHYRAGGDSLYQRLPMSRGADGRISATIPGSAVTSRGLEYFISTAYDSQLANYPENEAAAKPKVMRVRTLNLTSKWSTVDSVYQMISVPNQLQKMAPQEVFAPYGNYDRSLWRLLRWIQDDTTGDKTDYQEYTIHPNFDSLAPGLGFWLITAKAQKPIAVGEAISVATGESFTLKLRKGWNQIGTPFDFAIDWREVKKPAGMKADTLWVYHCDNKDGDKSYYPLRATRMEPWQAYFVRSEVDAVLKIPPHAATGPLQESIGPLAAARALQPGEWLLRLSASAGNCVDPDNYAGCLVTAAEGRDTHDFTEPPLLPGFVALSFLPDERQQDAQRYAGDFRPPSVNGKAFAFAVSNARRDVPIMLRLEEAWNLPQGWQAMLHDVSTERTIVLSSGGEYVFYLQGSQPHRFKLAVGADDFLRNQDPGFAPLPSRPELSQNFPNPFNPATTVRYSLPTAQFVRVNVYDGTGRLVRTLAEGWRSAGHYTVKWDGRDAAGGRLASGVYFIRMEAGAVVVRRKVVLAK